jgi:hypothetical protein
MVSFMVLGGPRSGTTWAANWLTTDTTICLHDPLLEYQIEFLNRLTFPGKKLGISCTSCLLYPDWVNAQQCPKVILYRDVVDINRSLEALGMAQLIESRHLKRTTNIRGAEMFPYEFLFSRTGAKQIAKFLGVPFDESRHDLLAQMRIEPKWRRVNVGRQAVRDLALRIMEAR